MFSNSNGALGNLWSLAVEEQFYLVWPPLLVVLLKRWPQRLPHVLAASFVSLVILSEGLFHVNPGIYYMPYSQALPLLAGCWLGVIMHRNLVPGWLSKIPLNLLSVLGFAGTWALVVHVGRGHLFVVQLVLASVSGAALILGLDRDSWVRRLLRVRVVSGLGVISYGFYLYYLAVLALVFRYAHLGHLDNDLVAFVITLLCALGSYLLIEKRFLLLKSRFELSPDFRLQMTVDVS